jgi:tetratricopeptide (TPR) repeat protein
VADIEPAVAEVAAFWAPRNHDLIKRGKFRLHINDGRNHLLVTTNRYDVITSDPFEPVVAGAANLYTVDHFELARSRLAPDGMMAQFLPLYELSREDLMMILRSFVRAFPRTSVFFTGSDTVLLGMTGNAEIDLRCAAAKMTTPEVAASLREIGINEPHRLLDMLVTDIKPGSALPGAGPVNTDEHPTIEFSAPRSALEYRADANQQVLLDQFDEIPSSYFAGLTAERAAEVRKGHAGLRCLLEASLCRSHGDLQRAAKALARAYEQAPASPIVRNEFSDSMVLLAAEAKAPEEGLEICKQAVQVDPTDFWATYNLILRADQAKQPTVGDEYLRRGLELYPDAGLLIALRGKRAGTRGDVEAACGDYKRVVEKLPRCAEFWQDYACFLERAGKHRQADEAAARAKELRRKLN